MQTTLRVDGANCPVCFNEAIGRLAGIDGVRAVHGSIGVSCIEIDHDDAACQAIASILSDRLHGTEMFGNEIEMVPIEFVALAGHCTHGQPVHQSSGGPERQPRATHISPSMTLGEIVTLHPSLAADLERRGLDYCCHGERTLEAAALEAGADAQLIADELSAARSDEPPAPWASFGPAELVDHIETVHHGYLRTALPRIGALTEKIFTVHGERHPELAEVQRLFTELRADLEPHLAREEEELFPAIREFATANGQSPSDVEMLAKQIAVLSSEHETVGALLEDLRRVSRGFETPADGCASYAACYAALAELEADTHLHVHKENNVLFPALRPSP